MKPRKIKAALFGVALAFAVPLAHSQTTTPGLYIGAGLGQSEAKDKFTCTGFTVCKKTGAAAKFFGGYQFHPNFAVEAGYTDLGRATRGTSTSTTNLEVGLGEMTVMGSYPVSDKFMGYGRLGGYYARSTATTTGSSSANEANGGVTFGMGAQYFLTNSLGVRGEFQRYMKVGGGTLIDIDYNAFTAGLLWKF